MTIEKQKYLFGHLISREFVPAGNTTKQLLEDDGMLGWYVYDEKYRRITVTSPDEIRILEEWESERKKREKENIPPHEVILKEGEIDQIKIYGFPGYKETLQWYPSK